METKRQNVRRLYGQWERGEIDKYDFYDKTMGYGIQMIAAVTGIEPAVIADRRRYLRQLERGM